MPSNQVYKAAGIFMTILGTLVLGIAAGMGLVAYMVKQRLNCVTIAEGAENACQDIVGPAMDMILAAGAGGFMAFACGLLAVGLVMHDEQQTGGEQ